MGESRVMGELGIVSSLVILQLSSISHSAIKREFLKTLSDHITLHLKIISVSPLPKKPAILNPFNLLDQ